MNPYINKFFRDTKSQGFGAPEGVPLFYEFVVQRHNQDCVKPTLRRAQDKNYEIDLERGFEMVLATRFELVTSSMSTKRSNQLS